MPLAFNLQLTLLALIVEGYFGYPDRIYRLIRHPVTWIGAGLAWMERWLNRGDERRQKGILTLVILLSLTFSMTFVLDSFVGHGFSGLVILALASSSLLAQRSLFTHVSAVADGLALSLADGRSAVAQIVGRDTEVLDEAGVARAAIESLAENFSDGVVAPAFWMALFGLPGAALYKAANTADSMIGHKNERYQLFGWAAARFDDVINLPASRLAALWLIMAALVTRGASAREAFKAVRRDARNHRSPNAGWPEAAMAGALGLKLAGPRVYGQKLVKDFYMGNGRQETSIADIRNALTLYRRACYFQMVVIGLLALILPG